MPMPGMPPLPTAEEQQEEARRVASAMATYAKDKAAAVDVTDGVAAAIFTEGKPLDAEAGGFIHGESVELHSLSRAELNGKALTVIDYEVRQVQRWPIGNSPLGALIDPSKDLSKFGKVIPTDDPSILSVQARDPKRPEFGTITMIFKRDAASPAGLQLYGWVALDSQNNRTAVRLTNQRYGAPVEDSAFRWTDPRPRGRSAGG